MTNTEYYGMFFGYWAKATGRFFVALACIPLAILGMMLFLPYQVLKLLYYIGRIVMMIISPGGKGAFEATTVKFSQRETEAPMSEGERVEHDARRIADGFNIDLERDFVGTPKVRL